MEMGSAGQIKMRDTVLKGCFGFLLMVFFMATASSPAAQSARLPENMSVSFTGKFLYHGYDQSCRRNSENGIYWSRYRIGRVGDEVRQLLDFRLFEEQRPLFHLAEAPGSDLYISNSGFIAFLDTREHYRGEVAVHFYSKCGRHLFSETFQGGFLFGFSSGGGSFGVCTPGGFYITLASSIPDGIVDGSGSLVNANAQTIDSFAPVTSVDTIVPYWNTTGSQVLTVTAADNLSGIASVAFYFYDSDDNASWDGPVLITTDTASPYTITFSFDNGSGYYRFYSIGVDNAGNTETAPTANDTMCCYDNEYPNSTINNPTTTYNNSLTNITGTATDTYSGVASVTITIYNSTDNTYFTGTNWQASSTDLTCNGTTSWYYEDTTAFPTWTSGKSYIINSTATDTAGNVELAADSKSFTYDTDNPTCEIDVP